MTPLIERPGHVEQLLAYVGEHPEVACWLHGLGADEGLDYCRECAEKQVRAGKAELVDGGYLRSEHDGCVHCETCGVVLDYMLTDHGVETELTHFEGCDFSGGLSTTEAFHISRILCAQPDNSEAIALADRALAALRAMESTNA